VASVIGRSFFLRILRAVAEADDAVEPGLAELEHAELIRLRQEIPELEYIFKHALVQEAAYGSILVERRRAIHRGVAQAIETLFADRLDEFTSLLAYHYALSENWEKAQEYLFRAGDQAGRMAADAEALEHYRQAEATYSRVAARELAPLQRATLDRKLGQAFYGVGNYDQAVEHCSRALAHLGVAYPRTRWGVRRSIVKFLVAHFLQRPVLGRRRARRHTMDLATAQEISTICRSRAWLDYWVDEERFALDSLIELYAGERSGDVLGRVRGLATLAIVLMTCRAFTTAQRRIVEANAIARRGEDPAAIALASLSRGWLEFVTGSLDEGLSALKESAAAFDGIGDIRGWAAPSSLICWIFDRKADFASLEKVASDVLRVGRNAGDPHVVAWGQNGLGLLAVTVGPLDEAASHLSAVCDLTARISVFRMQAGAGGTLAKCRLRQGRLAEAAATLKRSIELIEAKNLRGEWSAEPLNAFAELNLLEAQRLSGSSRRQALRITRRACTKALACSRDAPTWLAETQRLHGTLAWMSNGTRSAEDWWRKSLATAERVGMPIEQARTLLEMGRWLGDASLVDEATGVFERTGARVDLAFSLHARARLAGQSDGDVSLTLQHYDRAIAALDAAKVEYELGVALQRRAQLHKLIGRLDQAHADAATAQRCFAAVGAAVGREEIERDATASG
jgi:tetratricopeptide (TPR) repeat protein